MNIAIIGAGNVGATLGKGWAKKGHTIVYGVRDAASPKVASAVKETGGNSRAESIPQAAAFGEVVVLATAWKGTQAALQQAGNLQGKPLLDCTNPLLPDLSGLDRGWSRSGAEQVASWAPGAHVVKIFNSTGAANMANPTFANGPALMLYCGDDQSAKAKAAQLATDLGFDAVDAGPLTMSRTLEPMALLWICL
jgi:predicted dinucleotide-binding enzyme